MIRLYLDDARCAECGGTGRRVATCMGMRRRGRCGACRGTGDLIKAKIMALTKAQRWVFDQLCIGNDRGHHPRSLKVLVAAGLVDGHEQKEGLFVLERYSVPVHVHVRWTELCSREPPDVT